MNVVYKLYTKILDAFLTFLLYGMVAVVSVQIFVRYVFFQSIPWSEELSRYMFAWLIFLGASLGVREKIEIRIDLIDSFLPANLKPFFTIGQRLVSFLVMGLFCYSSFELISLGFTQLSPAMQVPMSFIYIAIAVGMAFCMIEIILHFIRRGAVNEKTAQTVEDKPI